MRKNYRKNYIPIADVFSLENCIFLFCLVTLAIPPLFIPPLEKAAPPFGSSVIPAVPNIVFAALYEESFYRLYLPAAMQKFLESFFVLVWPARRFSSNAAELFSEVAVILLFGFAHRYLGFPAVLYACAFGAFFRFLLLRFKYKTAGLITCSVIHIVNNILVCFATNY